MELEGFRDAIVHCFKENLQAILYYGSSVLQNSHTDVDIAIILKKKIAPSKDLYELRRIASQFPEIIFDLSITYCEEITTANNFSHDSHGCFFVYVFKEAAVLWGENPFLDVTPDLEALRESVVRKLQYYVFRARQMLIGETYQIKDKNRDFHRKKILMGLTGILLCRSLKLPESPLEDFEANYPGYLTSQEIRALSMGKKPLSIREAHPIYEKLYTFGLERLAS